MAKQETIKPFAMNLQLFADTEPKGEPTQAQPVDTRTAAMAILQGGQQAAAAPQQGQPQVADNSPQNSPQTNSNSGQQTGQQPSQPQGTEQPGQQQAPINPQDQLLLGKFKSPEDMANGYVNVEKAYTQKSQEVSALQQQLQAAQQAMNQMQQQIQSVVNPQQQQPQPTPEQQKEEILSKLYDDPLQFVAEITQKAKQEALQEMAPMQQYYQQQQQQAQWDNAISQFAQQTPDMPQFKDAMAEIIQQSPVLQNHSNPLEALSMAYDAAKGRQLQNPNALLQNQDFVNQIMSNQDLVNQILNNPENQQKVISNYLQGVKKGNQAPVVISGQVNGQTTVVPPNEPQTIKDARSIAEQYLKR